MVMTTKDHLLKQQEIRTQVTLFAQKLQKAYCSGKSLDEISTLACEEAGKNKSVPCMMKRGNGLIAVPEVSLLEPNPDLKSFFECRAAYPKGDKLKYSLVLDVEKGGVYFSEYYLHNYFEDDVRSRFLFTPSVTLCKLSTEKSKNGEIKWVCPKSTF